jgi:putative sigma-54 modulation protein
MRITFTGKQEKLNASQERKLAMAFARLSRLLEQKGEKEAQVILTSERHLQNAEIRLNYYDHKLVGAGAATDQFTAVMDAVEKVEKQAIKNRSKWREAKRDTPVRAARTTGDSVAMPVEEVKPAKGAGKVKARKAAKAPRPSKVVQATAKANGKPMTIEEAMLAMEDNREYMVYRDTETDKVSVLIRRRDGKVDLVEA